MKHIHGPVSTDADGTGSHTSQPRRHPSDIALNLLQDRIVSGHGLGIADLALDALVLGLQSFLIPAKGAKTAENPSL